VLKAESQRWRQLPYLCLTAGLTPTISQQCKRTNERTVIRVVQPLHSCGCDCGDSAGTLVEQSRYDDGLQVWPLWLAEERLAPVTERS
jgi:hypothetical protein